MYHLCARGVRRVDRPSRRAGPPGPVVRSRSRRRRSVGSTSFKLTKKNVDARTHTESKHPGKTFAECFPCVIKHEAELAAEASGGGGGGGKGGAGKTGGKKKGKEEDLSSLLDAGLAGVGKPVKKKK